VHVKDEDGKPDAGGDRFAEKSGRVHRSPLACSVRGCALPLSFRAGGCVCARGHTFDRARSGYLNLLQPHDRRSVRAGDSQAAVEARARLLAAGVLRGVVDTLVQRAASLDLRGETRYDLGGRERHDLNHQPAVVDLGCGSGDVLGAIADVRPIYGVGIDLSTAAVDHAARRFPALTWVVANADRRLPLLNRSVDLVLSLHARRNPPECARALDRRGFLIVVVPAADDLIELRAMVQGEGIPRDRTAALLAEHAPLFALLDRAVVRERPLLERPALLDLLRGTYRGERESAANRVAALDQLEVTLASEIFLFAPRR
jgi:23S rRNA (guanine745-N1)-methyltransferase